MLLIGDAAHTMSPVGGQGLNIAIRDAIVAANHLVGAFETGATPGAVDAATRLIEQERIPEVSRIQRMQARPPRVLLRDSFLNRLALQLLPFLVGSSFSPARRVGLLFAFGATDVKLVV